MFKLRALCFSFLIVFSSDPSFATVYEFDSDGSVEVFEATDYFSPLRHQKFRAKALLMGFEKSSLKKFDEYVKKASQKYNVSSDLIHAVIRAESAYNPEALSIKGAGGLMQLMPDTATQYGVADRFSPEENIDGGTKYLKFLLDRYEGDISLAVAAYNAGEGAVDKYGDVPPYPETKAYVQKVSLFLEKGN
ncbi:MAG TPA: lytic transglycosylase [Rhodospirillaceae bacterium]|nr:lytic transglycosylase [Rhodospirillaceae bacterium]